MLASKADVLPDAVSDVSDALSDDAWTNDPVTSLALGFKRVKAIMVPLKIQLANELFCANGINIRYTRLAHLQAFFLTSFTQLVFLCLI